MDYPKYYYIISGGRIHQNTKGYCVIDERFKRIVEKPFILDPFKKDDKTLYKRAGYDIDITRHFAHNHDL